MGYFHGHIYIMSYDLYTALTAYGDQYPLQISVNCNEILSELRYFESDWAQYNPRKLPNNRIALSITNSNGILGPGPDLDSLPEYNAEHGVYLDEYDFVVPTPVYDVFAECFEPLKKWLFRCHVIRLGPGGNFPPHIDSYGKAIFSFRLFIPLENCNPYEGYFILEDRILHWSHGTMYFINTCKRHLLFNPSGKDMTFVVLNVELNVESMEYILSKDIIL